MMRVIGGRDLRERDPGRASQGVKIAAALHRKTRVLGCRELISQGFLAVRRSYDQSIGLTLQRELRSLDREAGDSQRAANGKCPESG